MLVNDCFILLSEQMLKLWSWKLGKVMESHGMLKSSKSTNPVVLNQENFQRRL